MPALIWLSYLSLLVLGLLDNLRDPFFPEVLNDFHLNGETGSAFFAMTSLFAFIGSWSSHALVRRRSSLFLLSVSTFLFALGYAWIALCPTFPCLLLACAFFGFAYGMLNLAQNIMVYEASPPHLRRRLFSGLHSMYAASALLAPVMASLFRSFGLGWRACFLTAALLPLALSLTSLKFKAPPPANDQRPTRAMTRIDWGRCLLFSFMMAFYLWGEISASSRMVLWLRSDLGFSPARADLYLGGFFLNLLAGRIFFSFVHFPRLGNRLILTVSAFWSGIFYLCALHGSPLWLVFSGLAMSPFFPLAMEFVAESFREKSAQALGFVLGFGSLSVVFMHLLLGYCTDRYGLGRALHLAPVALLTVSLLLGLTLFTKAQTAVPKSR